MSGWAADRHITPRVVAHLAEHLSAIPAKRRASLANAQLVLHKLCQWARREDPDGNPGHWLTDESVEQIHVRSGLTKGTIRAALDCLEHVGLVVTLTHGGGRGEHARGATRRLILDPVENGSTPRGNPAEFKPILSGVDAVTQRGRRSTQRGQPRDTSSLPRYTSARDNASVDNSAGAVATAANPLIYYVPAHIYERFGHLMEPGARPRGWEPPQ